MRLGGRAVPLTNETLDTNNCIYLAAALRRPAARSALSRSHQVTTSVSRMWSRHRHKSRGVTRVLLCPRLPADCGSSGSRVRGGVLRTGGGPGHSDTPTTPAHTRIRSDRSRWSGRGPKFPYFLRVQYSFTLREFIKDLFQPVQPEI